MRLFTALCVLISGLVNAEEFDSNALTAIFSLQQSSEYVDTTRLNVQLDGGEKAGTALTCYEISGRLRVWQQETGATGGHHVRKMWLLHFCGCFLLLHIPDIRDKDWHIATSRLLPHKPNSKFVYCATGVPIKFEGWTVNLYDSRGLKSSPGKEGMRWSNSSAAAQGPKS